jgi:hypothetical protein
MEVASAAASSTRTSHRVLLPRRKTANHLLVPACLDATQDPLRRRVGNEDLEGETAHKKEGFTSQSTADSTWVEATSQF